MVRVIALLAVLAGCPSRPKPSLQGSGSASGSVLAVVADAAGAVVAPAIDAPAGPVELLHSYLAFVEVSSHVMNKTIKPEHLVDKSFETAWNSKSGELAGAWLEVWVVKAAVHELRLTVGHTGKGPKGEDYFTMNPRIKKLTVLEGDKSIVTVTLDPDNRALQSIKLPVPSTTRLRLRIDEVVMGTKKRWREVCVSELEAWGMPPADKQPEGRLPVVSVYEPAPPSPTDIVRGKPIDPQALCDAMVAPRQQKYDAMRAAESKRIAECRRENPRNSDHCEPMGDEDAPPDCGLRDGTPVGASPWKSVSVWRFAENSAHGPMTCNLVAHTEHGDFMIGEDRSCGPWDDELIELKSAAAEDVLPGGTPELVIRYASARGGLPLQLLVCRYTGNVQCTPAFEIEGATWKVKPRFSKGTVIFDPIEGKAPPEVSGPQSLSFD